MLDDVVDGWRMIPLYGVSPADGRAANLDFLFRTVRRELADRAMVLTGLEHPNAWVRLRSSPFDDPLMPFPSELAARHRLHPPRRDDPLPLASLGGPEVAALVSSELPGRSRGFHEWLAFCGVLALPIVLFVRGVHRPSEAQPMLRSLLSVCAHALTFQFVTEPYVSNPTVSRASTLQRQNLSAATVFLVGLAPLPNVVKTVVVVLQTAYLIVAFPQALSDHLRQTVQPFTALISSPRSFQSAVHYVGFSVADVARREISALLLYWDWVRLMTASVQRLVRRLGDLYGASPTEALRTKDDLSAAVTTTELYNVSRRSRQLGRERSAAVLRGVLEQPDIRMALTRQLGGVGLEVDDGVMSFKQQEGLAILEAHMGGIRHTHFAAAFGVRGESAVIEPAVDVYLFFPIRCAESGRTAILCVEGSTPSTDSVAGVSSSTSAGPPAGEDMRGVERFMLSRQPGVVDRQLNEQQQEGGGENQAADSITAAGFHPFSGPRFAVFDPWPRGSRAFAGGLLAAQQRPVHPMSSKDRHAADAATEQRSYVYIGANEQHALDVRRIEVVEARGSDYPALRESPLPLFLPTLTRFAALQWHSPDYPATLIYAAPGAPRPPLRGRPLVGGDVKLTVPLLPLTPEDTKRAIGTKLNLY